MKEIWKDILITEGEYQCSNLGRFRRVSHDAKRRNGDWIYLFLNNINNMDKLEEITMEELHKRLGYEVKIKK